MPKKPNKYAPVPYNPATMNAEVVTADAAGNPMRLPPDQDRMVTNLINSMTPNREPRNGIVFVPKEQYDKIRMGIEHGTLFGKPIGNPEGGQEDWAGGGTRLGDGFSLPQHDRTYLNNALLADPQRLASVLAHELGHNAAWYADPKHPDFSEDEADRWRNVLLDRRNQYIKLFQAIGKVPMNRPLQLGSPDVLPPNNTQNALLSSQ
jgi:hypothetical protein